MSTDSKEAINAFVINRIEYTLETELAATFQAPEARKSIVQGLHQHVMGLWMKKVEDNMPDDKSTVRESMFSEELQALLDDSISEVCTSFAEALDGFPQSPKE